MPPSTYEKRRGQLETYFDRTAAEAWSRLTSDAPVSRVRATVRAGRDEMRQTLLDWLPEDLTGLRLLDAGCGTGALAVVAARRGARVTATDISPTLISIAQERTPKDLGAGAIEFAVGDMLNPALGNFDHVVAMDSLVHYPAKEIVNVVAELSARCSTSMVFTFAPRTVALTVMHTVGQLFPRGNRSPAIEPVGESVLRKLLTEHPALSEWQVRRTARISKGFYISQALELVRRCKA